MSTIIKAGTKFYLFRSWGRIGSDSIGGTKIENFYDKENCLEAFYALFEEKSGNEFFAEGIFDRFCFITIYILYF